MPKKNRESEVTEEDRMQAEETPGEPVFVPEGPTTTNGLAAATKLDVVYLRVEEIMPDPLNPNEQSPETFNTLVSTIQEDGYDQPIVVCPLSAEERVKLQSEGYAVPPEVKYILAKGEHRWRAAKVQSLETVPSVIRDWDSLTRRTRLVRDNVLKGDLNKDKFTTLVDTLQKEHSLDGNLAASLLGFDTTADMYKHMAKEGKRKSLDESESVDRSKNELKVLDDLSLVLNTLFTKYGQTLPYGFMTFMWSGKIHTMVEMEGELKVHVEELGKIAVDRKVDISLILAAILRDGLAPFRTDNQPLDARAHAGDGAGAQSEAGGAGS